MITKIEINGFKTFHKFEMEFAPLTVVAGANASGKSNLFDAMQLLSQIVESDLKTAFSQQRGNANELFTQFSVSKTSDCIDFAVELLVDKRIKDKFGGEALLKYTRLRYEIQLMRTKNERGLYELMVVYELLNPIRHDEDKWVQRFISSKNLNTWRPKVKTGKRGIPYIDTEKDRINLRQDGKGGIKKEFPKNNIYQAIISIVNSVDFPHALAAKEEIRNWKFLQLNPEDLREPSSYLAKDNLTHTGQNLAAVLHRIKVSDAYRLKSISRKLNSLLPSIANVDVIDDKVGKQFVVQIKTVDKREFTSRVLSEGTLRLLILCVFLNDPAFDGIICFEEPENGIHPARMRMTVSLLEELVTHFDNPDSELKQVIVNTHSPVLLKEIFALHNRNLFLVWYSQLVMTTAQIGMQKEQFQITRMSPVTKGSNQLSLEYSDAEKKLTLSKVDEYLQSSEIEKVNEIA